MKENEIDVSNAKILIVDDTPANIDILWKMLETEGYNISGVPNGQIALELVSKIQPCLILLDVMMPDMDGYEVCRRLKANPVTEHIPVIFITAKSEPRDIVQAFSVGGDDYITKPFYQDEVKSRILIRLRLRKLLHENMKLIEDLSEKNRLLSKEKAKKNEFS
ncbi:MAG: response regulator [Gammaproteobacteria bacterium]|nr:response regulator [Gammaproteobacteria bacterium]